MPHPRTASTEHFVGAAGDSRLKSIYREPVQSSNLVSVGYLESVELLEIEFHGGRVYQYYNVPKAVYQALMNASSHGSYHYHNIRTDYPYVQVEGE